MPYRYATERPDYSDLSSGKVLLSLPGHPAFPIRLASEMVQRCTAQRTVVGPAAPCVVYDPCCGAGYLLSTVSYLHPEMIGAAIGSDIDAQAVALARRNLGMLNLEGLDQRIAELEALSKLYGKESHRAALESAGRLRRKIMAQPHEVLTRVFRADATRAAELAAGLNGQKIDIVLTDIPYGQHSQWFLPEQRVGDPDPLFLLLDALTGSLAPGCILAVASSKGQKIAHPAYQRREHFQIGKRQVVVLKATSAD